MDMATDPAVTLSDQLLVEGCLAGDSQSWEMLLERYKRLIYSVPVRFGFDHEDRHEIFQIVCLEILKNMPSIRDAGKLRSWILTITIRESNDLLRRKCAERDKIGALHEKPVPERAVDTLSVYLAAEKEAILREALAEMPLRCRTLIELLFFGDSPVDYGTAGAAVGLSKESIGCIRLRCLDRLKRILESRNFPAF
ncbi:MAG TPA: sigma-70 family RNA polymerase sigma factor [Terriglobia bacterium]|nr:sigma-70 family RNA polymerase sigma factor [Terriglobia bacterium]